MKFMQVKYLFLMFLASGPMVQGICAYEADPGDIVIKKIGLSQGIPLDTSGGIVDGKRCVLQKKFGDIPTLGESNVNHFIVCEDGTRFEDAVEQEGSATGTPPALMYSNYIGSYTRKVVSDMPGAQRRMMYFDGAPEAKE